MVQPMELGTAIDCRDGYAALPPVYRQALQRPRYTLEASAIKSAT